MRNLLLLVALVAACGSDTSAGVSEQEAEIHCRAWCDGGCGTDDNPESCRQSCRSALARLCGEHAKAEHDCMTALRCSDPFNDCDHHYDEGLQCYNELVEYCAQCEGTPEQESTCTRYSGECGSDLETARCEYEVRSGWCSDMECCLLHGHSSSICRP
jgi:hypothetical protein